LEFISICTDFIVIRIRCLYTSLFLGTRVRRDTIKLWGCFVYIISFHCHTWNGYHSRPRHLISGAWLGRTFHLRRIGEIIFVQRRNFFSRNVLLIKIPLTYWWDFLDWNEVKHNIILLAINQFFETVFFFYMAFFAIRYSYLLLYLNNCSFFRIEMIFHCSEIVHTTHYM
jgi:hypothetical protein